MRAETREIALRDRSGREHAAVVTLHDADDGSCTLTLECSLFSGSQTMHDHFGAFELLRSRLWSQGLVPLCYAASRNVYPSGMTRQMGGGRMAYRVTFGKQALSKDLVDIFDRGPDIDPVTPEEQRAFFEQWIASLGRQQPPATP